MRWRLEWALVLGTVAFVDCGGQSVEGDGAGGSSARGGGAARGGNSGTATGGTGGTSAAGSSATGSRSSCSPTPTIPEGATFRVTILQETADSDKCHVVNMMSVSPFMVTAGPALPPFCVTPGLTPPMQTDVLIQSCSPAQLEVLGVECEIQYRSTCEGRMLFYFVADTSVDWSTPTITGARYRVQDFASACLPDLANCTDEYSVRLERITP